MSVATAILGYFAAGPQMEWLSFSMLLVGVTMAAFGCGVLNQWWEREADARMQRTADRPVAAGRIQPLHALLFGTALSVAGVASLWLWVNAAAAVATGLTVLLYIFAYTPMKRRTPLATEVGAIPGALPPLVGWLAAGAGFSAMGWLLFAILFAWQIPHFMAISWMCREDYQRGGFRMLALEKDGARKVARKALLFTVVLIALGFMPLFDPAMGWLTVLVGSLLSYLLLAPAIRWFNDPQSNLHARKLFLATLIHLPVLLSAIVVDRFFI
jgi:protoheme IX farnesyltransferase